MRSIVFDHECLFFVGRLDRHAQRNDGNLITCGITTTVLYGFLRNGLVGRHDEIPFGGLVRNAVLSIEVDVNVIETTMRPMVACGDDKRVSVGGLSSRRIPMKVALVGGAPDRHRDGRHALVHRYAVNRDHRSVGCDLDETSRLSLCRPECTLGFDVLVARDDGPILVGLPLTSGLVVTRLEYVLQRLNEVELLVASLAVPHEQEPGV